MNIRIVILGAALILVAPMLILGSGKAPAQTQTCSGLYAQCVQSANRQGYFGPYGKCGKAKAECMRAGRWTGPDSGKDYGPALKK